MYITQRTTLFDALFTLLTLYASIRAWDAGGQAKWQAAAWLACALGMASKETMVTVPLLIPLYDRAFFCDSWRDLWQGAQAALWWTGRHVGRTAVVADGRPNQSNGWECDRAYRVGSI